MQHERAAPAKINLSLRVVGRREDGYHELDSLFVPLALADRVTVELEEASSSVVTCTCPGRPDLDGAENLAARAAKAYLARTGRTARVRLTVEKRVWAAAGLGGGSSDAAAVLRALNDAFHPLSEAELATVALGLGADVPFFLLGRAARAQGIGERLTPLSGLPLLDLVLANPGTPLGTAEVYRALGLTPGERRPAPPQPVALDGRLESVLPLIWNDLEPPAARLCPEIPRLRARLAEAGALATGMSGSGPTVFGLFRSPEEAGAAALFLKESRGVSALATQGGCSLTHLFGSPI
ncbi:MAG: 4-(cytidine 5'-diphospho)-2-C-methyl-D-erythritol kinase [Deltaproteobacteria bacterium]|nr:4-(cytidine 5'-diphospho)-2-C-methyl-D-erythritol kinase [Deltaproteobacteria bacterium]